MCFLTAGNICAQTTLPLYVDNGISSNPRYDKYGFNYEFEIEENGTKVLFKDDGTNPPGWIGYSCVGGANWAATYSSGETHTFTVTLNAYSGLWNNKDVVGELHIAALDCVISNQYQTYSGNIVAEASINPRTASVLTLEVNSPYAAVYLFKKNRDDDYEYVDIASVTRTVATPVNISESANNSITKQDDATVNLTRTLVKNTWNTICLPFAPTQAHVDAIFGVGAKFAQFSSVSNGVMQFTSVEVDDLQAGTPYLVLPTQDKTDESPIKLTGVNITATEPGEVTYGDYTGDYTFKGIYILTSFEKDDHKIRFVATGNKLKYPSTTNPLKALRAYFIVPDGSGVSSPAKDYFYDVDSFVPTSIANIQIEGDGDGAIYNIGGQRVEGKSLPKGIYIREGKKFVVK